MTVSSTSNRKSYAGDGVTTSFATTPVIFFNSSELVVYDVVTATGVVTATLTENTNYTVSGGSGVTGTVNLAAGSSPYGAPPAGHTLLIVRTLPLTQASDLVNNDNSDAEVVEDALDKLTMVDQQQAAQIARSFVLADSDVSGASTVLPTPTATSLLGWNSGPTALVNYSTSALALALTTAFTLTLLDDVDADTFVQTLVATITAETAPATDDVVLIGDTSESKGNKMTLLNLLKVINSLTTDNLPIGSTDFMLSYDTSASAVKKVLLDEFPLPMMAISGLTYANNAGDAVNDLDFAVGAARDATNATNIRLASALTKRSDATFVVGTNQGMLDTGAIGNSDYYLWLIKRSDTGVVDIICSLSSTAPTMPGSYDYKRLFGWFKRVGGTIVAFHTYETEGGGLAFAWDTPTSDISLVNTLTTTARTDALKVPLNFSVEARIFFYIGDVGVGNDVTISCPDQTDIAMDSGGLGLRTQVTNVVVISNGLVRTSSTGTIRSKANVATMDNYVVFTNGFSWARRN